MNDEAKVATLGWLERLLAEVREFDSSMFQPTSASQRGEQVLGDCPDEAKPFYALAQFYARECARIQLEEKFQAEETSREDHIRYRQMDQKHDALIEIFWGVVFDALQLGAGQIGVRKGWKIVVMRNTDPLEQLKAMLEH